MLHAISRCHRLSLPLCKTIGESIMQEMVSGSCGCGSVKINLNINKCNVVNCHCNTCRKLNGSAFSTYVVVSEKNFKIETGISHISKFVISKNGEKNYCNKCGTPIFNKNYKYPSLTMIHLGTLNLLQKVQPKVNIFCQSMLSWVAFKDEIASFEKEIIQ